MDIDSDGFSLVAGILAAGPRGLGGFSQHDAGPSAAGTAYGTSFILYSLLLGSSVLLGQHSVPVDSTLSLRRVKPTLSYSPFSGMRNGTNKVIKSRVGGKVL
jgi:hypothetical protein